MLFLIAALCVAVTVAQFDAEIPQGGARAWVRVFNLVSEDDNDIVLDRDNDVDYDGPGDIDVFYTTSDDDTDENDDGDKDESISSSAGFNDYEEVDLPVDERGNVFDSQGTVYISNDIKICDFDFNPNEFTTLTITSEIDERTESGDCVDDDGEFINTSDRSCTKVIEREISFDCNTETFELPQRKCNQVPVSVTFQEELDCPLFVLRSHTDDNELLDGESILHDTLNDVSSLTRSQTYTVNGNALTNEGVHVDFQVEADATIGSNSYGAANFNFVNAANRAYDDDGGEPEDRIVDDELTFVITDGNTVIHVQNTGVGTGAESGWLRLSPGDYDVDVYSGNDGTSDIFASPQTLSTPVRSTGIKLSDGDALILVVTGSSGSGDSDDDLNFEEINVPADALFEGETEHHIYNFIDNFPVAIANPDADENCCNFIARSLDFKDSVVVSDRDANGDAIVDFIDEYDVFPEADKCRDLAADALDGGSVQLGTLDYDDEKGLCGRQVHLIIGRTYEEREGIDGCDDGQDDEDNTVLVTKVGDLDFIDQDGSGNMVILTIDAPHCACGEVEVDTCEEEVNCAFDAEFDLLDSRLDTIRSSVGGIASNVRQQLALFTQQQQNTGVSGQLNAIAKQLDDIEDGVKDAEDAGEDAADAADDAGDDLKKAQKKIIQQISKQIKKLVDNDN